jgi:hypothetical protein
MSDEIQMDNGDDLYECPECGAQAAGNEDFTPGHLHGSLTDGSRPTFVQYVLASELEPVAPRRRRKTTTEV